MKSGVRATKSVSQLISTIDAMRPPAWTYVSMTALICGAAHLLLGLGQSALTEQIGRLFDIAAGLFKRALALHDAGAGLLAQFFDERGSNH